MALPRFKEKEIGPCPSSITASEYEASVRSFERSNAVKRAFNKMLDIIDRQDKNEKEKMSDREYE